MKIFIVLLTLISFLSESYTSQDQSLNSFAMLEKYLEKESYSSLFFKSNYNKVDSAWNAFHKQDFQAIINNNESENMVRLLASEILFMKDKDYPNDSLVPTLCEIYSEAIKDSGPLAKSGILPANVWGFMYANDNIGYLGKRLLSFGDSIIPPLMKLIDITSPVLYVGSRDAKTGNGYHYRIKDIAAFYIAKVKDIPITFYPNFEERDKEIELLIAQLEKQ